MMIDTEKVAHAFQLLSEAFGGVQQQPAPQPAVEPEVEPEAAPPAKKKPAKPPEEFRSATDPEQTNFYLILLGKYQENQFDIREARLKGSRGGAFDKDVPLRTMLFELKTLETVKLAKADDSRMKWQLRRMF